MKKIGFSDREEMNEALELLSEYNCKWYSGHKPTEYSPTSGMNDLSLKYYSNENIVKIGVTTISGTTIDYNVNNVKKVKDYLERVFNCQLSLPEVQP